MEMLVLLLFPWRIVYLLWKNPKLTNKQVKNISREAWREQNVPSENGRFHKTRESTKIINTVHNEINEVIYLLD
jgi:hypothetical protein